MILLSLLLLSNLTACTKEVVRVPYMVEKKIPLVSKPKQVQMKRIYFYVVSDKNMKAFQARYLKKHQQMVFIALSPKDYENLSSNVSELTRYIKDQKAIIEYYENSITAQTKIKKDNK